MCTAAVQATRGVIGGIYGIGGGSPLSPILVGRGLPLATVAPATLVSTFIAGAITYVVLAATAAGQHIAPHWTIGLVAGTGGLVGSSLGARLHPRLPEHALRASLGALAIATATLYAIQALR